jgi:hypothetical protein
MSVYGAPMTRVSPAAVEVGVDVDVGADEPVGDVVGAEPAAAKVPPHVLRPFTRIVTLAPVPLQSPVQPTKVYPASGEA